MLTCNNNIRLCILLGNETLCLDIIDVSMCFNHIMDNCSLCFQYDLSVKNIVVITDIVTLS